MQGIIPWPRSQHHTRVGEMVTSDTRWTHWNDGLWYKTWERDPVDFPDTKSFRPDSNWTHTSPPVHLSALSFRAASIPGKIPSKTFKFDISPFRWKYWRMSLIYMMYSLLPCSVWRIEALRRFGRRTSFGIYCWRHFLLWYIVTDIFSGNQNFLSEYHHLRSPFIITNKSKWEPLMKSNLNPRISIIEEIQFEMLKRLEWSQFSVFMY